MQRQVKTSQGVREFIKEMGEEGKNMGIQSCKEAIHAYLEISKDYLEMYKNAEDEVDRCFYRQWAIAHARAADKLRRRLKMLENNSEGLTDAEIERAREYPISQLIEVGRNNKARCINHDDNNPSMDCRNNFAYCYVCGYKADSIGIYMKLHGTTFVSAVRALQ